MGRSQTQGIAVKKLEGLLGCIGPLRSKGFQPKALVLGRRVPGILLEWPPMDLLTSSLTLASLQGEQLK